MKLYKKMALVVSCLFFPYFCQAEIYYYNGVPVQTETNQNLSYGNTIISNGNSLTIIDNNPVILQNGTTIIINKNNNINNNKIKTDEFNSGEKRLPNNGIVRPGTPYLSGNGNVRNNHSGRNQDINIQTEQNK